MTVKLTLNKNVWIYKRSLKFVFRLIHAVWKFGHTCATSCGAGDSIKPPRIERTDSLYSVQNNGWILWENDHDKCDTWPWPWPWHAGLKSPRLWHAGLKSPRLWHAGLKEESSSLSLCFLVITLGFLINKPLISHSINFDHWHSSPWRLIKK